jgi:undecaprenyl-diphosphatase
MVLSRNRSTLAVPGLPRISPALAAFAFSSVFLALFADALIHERSFFDAWGLKLVQRVDGPLVATLFDAVNLLTSSQGAVAMWTVTLFAFVAKRWWVPAMAVAVLPVGGGINWVVGELTQHVRPSGDEFIRTVDTNAASFPSGHVMGAVMLYGFLFLAAARIESPAVRTGVRAFSVAAIVLVGPARLWEGAHWPSDVIAAYALGATLLAGLYVIYERLDRSVGHLPLVRQGWFPHYGIGRHAHALTSLVIFNEDKTVSKVYSPGLLPRILYWVSFQAPFPYIANRNALQAAAARRNLAADLTEFWFGTSRVARVVGIDEYRGQFGIRSEFVVGGEPHDRAGAKAFLVELRNRFEESGLPTWQIDPRQPRAIDNVMESEDGRYMIVDLESGLVAPIASPKSFVRGIRRGQFPLYDDVYVDITRAYVAENAAAIEATLGAERLAAMQSTLEELATAQAAWHASEPRLFGRFFGGFRNGWGFRTWPARLQTLGSRGEAKASGVMHRSISAWLDEGRITAAQAGTLRAQVDSAEIRSVMPHLGAHGVISIFLRFPFGSIARPAWTLANLLLVTAAVLLRKRSFKQWRASFSIHSPLVLIVAAIPGFGAFAYLLAAPVRRNRLLVRAVGDHLMLKVPGGLYERMGVRRIIAPAATRPAARPETHGETVGSVAAA